MSMMELGVPQGTVLGAQRWHQLIASVFGDVDISLGDEERFTGQIRHASLAGVELADVSCAYEDAVRTRRHVAGDRKESFVFVAPLSGSLEIEQHANRCELAPGQFAIFDLNAPHRYYHAAPVRALSLKLPGGMLRTRLRKSDDLVATAFAADRGVARIGFDFFASVLRDGQDIPAPVALGFGPRMADMAAVMLDCSRDDIPVGNASVRQAIHQRCVQLIESQLGDPRLSPARIASGCGISTRYLHKVFQETDQTLGEYIRNRRLAVCRDRLTAQQGQLQIKEVALSAGFRSVSHFCNAFKARYGVSPRDVRAVARERITG